MSYVSSEYIVTCTPTWRCIYYILFVHSIHECMNKRTLIAFIYKYYLSIIFDGSSKCTVCFWFWLNDALVKIG